MNKRILFVGQHRLNRSPSQRYRFEQYFSYLESRGMTCDLAAILDERDDRIFYQGGHYFGKLGILLRASFRRLRDVLRANDYDVILVQREAFMLGTTVFERLFRRSRAQLVFDFDDSIWLPGVSEANRLLGFLKRPQKTGEIIAICDLVLAGNQYLANYARQFNSNVEVFPTTIDTEDYQRRFRKPPAAEQICVGWSGSFSTIPHFESVLPALTRLKAKYQDRIRFKVIGDPSYRHEALGIVGHRWTAEREVEDLSDIDIGLMPLPTDEWTRGKCGCKGLQYMALAIPTLMSPVGVNTEIISDGVTGFLPVTIDDWVSRISELVESPSLRKQIGEKGQHVVEERYSVRATRERYFDLLSQLGRSPAAEDALRSVS